MVFTIKYFLLNISILKIINASPTPIVLWHGMGDTSQGSLSSFIDFLGETIPGVYVHSLKIGNSSIEEFENSYFLHPNTQVEYACEMVINDVKLVDGFNAIGFSQGSQFLRALAQRCGHKTPTIKNLITLGGQHQGVYGLPHCGAMKHKTCDYVRKLLNYAAYNKYIQASLVQATYWHDPLDEETYVMKSEFLADINNERVINETYIKNLNKLENFVMVLFESDSMVQPKESEWFGFYAPGQAQKILKLQESDIYTQDRLGLKSMDDAGKLAFLSVPGDHLHFDKDWFVENIVKKYLL